jgi:putative redox protein
MRRFWVGDFPHSVIEFTSKPIAGPTWGDLQSGRTNAVLGMEGIIMQVKIRCIGGTKFEMTAGSHRVLSDQPLENGGSDAAMTPPELFLSALGSCSAYYAEEYLRARGLPDEDLEIHVSAEKGGRPLRIVSLRIDVIAPGLTQRHRDGLLRAVDACLLTHTLHTPPRVEVHVAASTHAAELEELAPACAIW